MKKSLKCFFGFHDWKYGDKPKMIPDGNYICSYQIDLTCKKCGKEKKKWSDLHLGMKIINMEEDDD